MKELTIEQKAKAYDEAIKRASKLRVQNPFDTVSQMMEHVYPELKESEDEKIRKSLIILLQHFCKGYRVPGLNFSVSFKEMLAWLEKQGEQKLQIEKLPEKMKTIGESLGFTTQEECDEYNQMVSNLIMSDDNKDKTKFKVGDIVRKKDGDGLEWTILSAEDNKCYKIANEDYDNVVILDDTWEVVEQVTVWSNEDERILKGILGYIGHGQHYGVRNSEMLTWLKSLKERYTWKPSKEKMHAFEQVYDWYNNNFAPSETLTSLYKDLKKLKGE